MEEAMNFPEYLRTTNLDAAHRDLHLSEYTQVQIAYHLDRIADTLEEILVIVQRAALRDLP
jgi:hypothetical protein